MTTEKRKPSAEEIEEKRRQRAEKKRTEGEKRAAGEQGGSNGSSASPLFAPRSWVSVKGAAEGGQEGETAVRVLSWNILAQGLVRRKLFPGSDCLKWKEREGGLCAEMRSHEWDIGAFQEVDKIEVHGPNLESSGRHYLYAKGYSAKQHGLMIAWRVERSESRPGEPARLAFRDEPSGSKVVYFDQECVGPKEEGRRGSSRVTRNIALFVALPLAQGSGQGVIVATTHLFWHPMHAYERVRQTGILKRALQEWREENNEWKEWPIVLAGDFNDQPHSATYKLMTGERLTRHNWDEVKSSSVVHKSIDEARQGAEGLKDEAIEGDGDKGGEGGEEGEEGEGGEGEDQMLKNCRHALPEDRLLSFPELVRLHDLSLPRPKGSDASMETDGKELIGHSINAGLISAYGAHYGSMQEDQEGNFFGSRGRGRERFDDPDWTSDSPNPHLGPCKEPMWTLHSTIFALTLDYIFLFPSPPPVTALLPTHPNSVLQPGVPRKGVCASDHVAIGAQLSIPS